MLAKSGSYVRGGPVIDMEFDSSKKFIEPIEKYNLAFSDLTKCFKKNSSES
jgi:hypothetical protein